MTTKFYIADLTDLTYQTPLIDFLGFASPSGTGFTVADGTLDLGVIPAIQEWLHAGPEAGGILAQSYPQETYMTFSLMSRNTSYDDLLDDILDLAKALAAGGVIVWQPDQATAQRFIDFYPCEIPALFRGQDRAMFKAINLLRDPEGLPMNIPRHPLMRGAEQTLATSVAISNAEGDSVVTLDNPGNWPSEARLTVAFPDAGGKGAQVRCALRSSGDLTEFASIYQFTPVAPVALGTTWAQIWRWVISPTDETALYGTYRVFAAMKLLDKDEFEVQMRWGMVDQQPAGATADVIDLDNSGYAAFNDFADVDLGYVTFDQSGSELVIEAWARSDTGANIAWDVVTLFPVDEAFLTLASPGQRFGRFGKLEVDPEEMTESVGADILTDDDGVAILHVTDDYLETPLETLAPGIHVYQFAGRLRNTPWDYTEDTPAKMIKRTLGELRIIDDGDNLVDSSALVAKKGRQNTGYGDDGAPRRCVFVADGVTQYKARVIFTEGDDGKREIRLRRLKRWYIPTLQDGRQMVADMMSRSAWIADTTGARWWPLEMEGPFLKVPPDNSVLVFRLGDASMQGALHDSDAREPLAKAVSARNAEVTVTVTPRFTH